MTTGPPNVPRREIPMSTWSADAPDVPALPAPETGAATRTATTRPYVEAMIEALRQAGDQPVLRCGGADTTGDELLAAMYRYSRALESLGVARGDLVAMYAPNRPEALALRYATHLLGVASVYLSAPPDPGKRAQMLVSFRPRLVVVFPDTAHLLPPTTTRVGAIGPVPGVTLRLDELAGRQDPAPMASRARLDDLAVVLSSGGTTGVPKGSVRDFAAYTAMVAVPSPLTRRQLANGNLAYLTQVLVDTTLLGGGTVVLQDGFDAAATLAAIEEERITHLFLVEPQLFDLMDHPDVAGRDLSSLRVLTHIGASAAPVLRMRARERLGPVIAHTYGASEMGIVSALTPPEHDLARPDLFSCAGRVLPGVQVRFRSSDGTLDARVGAIEVRSPAMASGYLRRPVEQAANFVDGWSCTGDLGHLDEQDHLHIHGRVVDCAEIDGRLLSPAVLQELLCRRSDVRYAVIVLDPDTGTRIVVVLPWPGRTVDTTGCLDTIAEVFGSSVASTMAVLPMDRMPLTEQGKPNRPEIRRLGREPAGVAGRRPCS
jgi:fatty-acyl-CoA synthase